MPIDLRRELTELRRAILGMGSVVEQRVDRVLDALDRGDVELARTVRTSDREIDEMENDIESECLRVLALCQPVAADLRLVMTVLRINGTLERIGDNAKSIAKRIIDLGPANPHAPPRTLAVMAEAARGMLADALTGLAEHDAALCRRVRGADEQVDAHQKEIFTWIQEEIPRRVDATRAAINYLSIARRLERIADLATNIAEDVIFLVEGALVRHLRA
jgi:phosphate transport system protein